MIAANQNIIIYNPPRKMLYCNHSEANLRLEAGCSLFADMPKIKWNDERKHDWLKLEKQRAQARKESKPIVKAKTKHVAATFSARLVKKATVHEKMLMELLVEGKVNFEFQKPFLFSNYFYIADFYFPHLKLVIEIDGKQHFSDKGKAYDHKRTMQIKKAYKCEVIRYTNEQIENIPLEIAALIMSMK